MKTYLSNLGYSINKEFTGNHHNPTTDLKCGEMYVARFRGEFIGSELTYKKAELLCIFHDDERTIKIL